MDPLRRKVTVARVYSIVGRKKILGSTQTHERRTLTFPRSLKDAPEAHAQGKGPADLLVASADGQPLDNSNFTQRVLNRAWKSAGLERLTFHDLRHTAASIAVQAGGNVKTVQNMLGHASATMTLDTYAGLFNTDAQALADRMDEARERAISRSSAHYAPTDSDNVVAVAIKAEPAIGV